jgi:hypothetical protein
MVAERESDPVGQSPDDLLPSSEYSSYHENLFEQIHGGLGPPF